MSEEKLESRCFTYKGGHLNALSVEAARDGPLSEVQTLCLQRNRALKEPADAAALATTLADLCNLQILDVSSCALGDASVCSLAPGMRHLSNLKRLQLSCNSFGASGVQALVKEAFPSLVELHDLAVDSCSLDAAATSELAGGLPSLVKLKALRMGGNNDVGAQGFKALREQAFPQIAATLKELDLQALQGLSVTATATELGRGLPILSGLKLLDVSKCGLTPASLQVLCTGLGELQNLETLRLACNRLGKEGCSALATGPFSQLQKLKELNASRCGLDKECMKELAPGLGHLLALERLILLGNPMDKAGAVALGDVSALQRLINLQELDVSYCGLGYMPMTKLAPAFAPLVKLKHLILAGNEFGTDGCEALAEKCLKHLTELRILDIRNCDIAKPAVEALAPAVLELRYLEKVDIGWDKQTAKFVKHLKRAKNSEEAEPARFPEYKRLNLNSSEAGELTKELASSLQHFPNLEILSFRGTQIIEKSAVALCGVDALPILTRLRELNISRCKIKHGAMKELAPGLGKLIALQVLNMQDNELGTPGAVALAEKTFPYLTQLRDLVVSNCDLEGAAFVALAPGLQHLQELTRLHMVGNEMGNDGARALANIALPCLVKLIEFNASFCSISADAMEELTNGLKHAVMLQVLILSCNDFGAPGVLAIAKYLLPHLSQLRKLDIQLVEMSINGEDVDPGFLQEVAPALAQATNLESLQLMGNKLGMPGTQAILVGVLPHLKKLKELDLSYVGMDTEAMLLFVPVLCELINMEILNLRNNKFGREGAIAMGTEVLPKMKKLKNLDLRMCGLEEVGGIESLFPGIAQLYNLEVVEFGDKRLLVDFVGAMACRPVEASEMGKAPQLRSFKELKLDGVKLDGDSMIEITPGLSHLTDLEVLSLRNNELGVEGAAALGTALMKLTKLRELYLAQCSLDDTCIELLVPSLKQLLFLEKLNFVGNKELTPEAAKLLASEVLPHLRHLKEVSVMDCAVGSDGVDALEDAVIHQAVVNYTGM